MIHSNMHYCAVIILTHFSDTSHMTKIVWRKYSTGFVRISVSHFAPKKWSTVFNPKHECFNDEVVIIHRARDISNYGCYAVLGEV